VRRLKPIIHELFQTVRFLQKELNEELKKHDLFHSQWSILFCIKNNGPMAISAISKYFNVEAPTISRTVTRLEQLDWVERSDGEDKREKIVHLTERGQWAINEISNSVVHFEDEVINRITEKEQETLRRILAKLTIEG